MTAAHTRRRWMISLSISIGCLFVSFIVLLGGAEPQSSSDEAHRLFGLWRFRQIALVVVLLIAGFGFAIFFVKRKTFLAYSSMIISVTLFLGVLEVLGRSGAIHWEKVFIGNEQQTDSIGWTLIPNQSVKGKTNQDIAARFGLPSDPIPFEFSTDRYGFRNDTDVEADIILLGDSIVLGAAVSFDKTVAAVLQDATQLPVMQAALLGLSIQEQHEMLLSSGVPLANKTIVQFLFEGNDLLDSRTFRKKDEQSEVSERQLSLLKLIWNKLVRLSRNPADFNTCMIGDQQYAFLWTRRSFVGHDGEFEHITRSTEAFSDTVRGLHARYLLVFVPTKYRVLENLCSFPEGSMISNTQKNLSSLPEIITEWSRAKGISLLDLTSPLKEAAAKGEIPWFWGDTHWNAKGHMTAGIVVGNWPFLRVLVQ